MPDSSYVQLSAHDNYVLLETAYLLLHAARDIICNNTGDLYALLRDHGNQETQKQLHSILELLNTAIGDSFRILEALLTVDRASWNP